MLLCLSIDHRGDAFPLLERIERRTDTVTRAFADPALAAGSVVLATCNRFEVYLDGDPDPDLGPRAIARLAEASAIPRAELAAAAELHPERRAAEHLFAVAGGLKSAVIGEEEIAGQVRRAHAQARSAGTVTHRLERLFQTATRTSREITRRTRIRSAGRSLVRLALVLAESRIASWEDARVLLIGTGAYAGATAAALRDRGADRVRVHSPSGRAEAFAAARGLAPVDPGGLPAALAEADVVIACSRAEEPLLTAADLAAAPAAGPRLLIDLGMPRNIASEAAALSGNELLDLETIARHAPIPELSAEAEAHDIVAGAAAEFAAAQAERDAVPALVALRDHVHALLEDEVGRASRSGAVAGGDVEGALRHFAGRLLHEPTTRIRGLGREGRADEAHAALAALFGLEAPAR